MSAVFLFPQFNPKNDKSVQLDLAFSCVVCASVCGKAQRERERERGNLIWFEKPQKGKGACEKISVCISQSLVLGLVIKIVS